MNNGNIFQRTRTVTENQTQLFRTPVCIYNCNKWKKIEDKTKRIKERLKNEYLLSGNCAFPATTVKAIPVHFNPG